MNLPRLENWIERYGRVHGAIYGDPRWLDGQGVTTSSVVSLDRETRQLQTLNTLYELGKEAV